MKPKLKTTLILTGALLLPSFLQAFPPAPHHTFQGMLRDEYGRPITWEEAQIFFETANGEIINGQAGEVLLPGVNYRMKVPMDAGTTRELYQPFAMKADMPFNIHVKVGLKTYLPIEMMGSIKKIGQPGVITPLDLTLGEDTDGDGLPDAWERALLGNGRMLGGINPNDDNDPGLDRDDTDGAGPENLNLNEPEDTLYKVGVHYFEDNGIEGYSRPTVRIYIFTSLLLELEGPELYENDMWEVAAINWSQQQAQPVYTTNGGFKVIPNYPTGIKNIDNP